VVTGLVTPPALLHGRLDHPQFGWAGLGGGQAAGGDLLDPANERAYLAVPDAAA